MDIYTIFGSNIHRLRTKAGYSQAELAELIDVSDSTISEIERGNRGTTFTNIEKLADILCDGEAWRLFVKNDTEVI